MGVKLDTDTVRYKCGSCRRTLPERFYGVDRSQTGSRMPRCKDCHKFHRKVSYRKNAPPTAPVHDTPLVIYPLRRHNHELLGFIPSAQGGSQHLIRGTSLESGQRYVLEIKPRLDMVHAKIWIASASDWDAYSQLEASVDILSGEDYSKALPYVELMLLERDIRLHLGNKLDI